MGFPRGAAGISGALGEDLSVGLGIALMAEMRRVAGLLLFRVDGDSVRIIALAHRRQEPGYWRRRR